MGEKVKGVRPVTERGAVILQLGAEKRPLTQTERVTLSPIHWVVLVDNKRVLKTPPDQTKDGVVQRRCHSVQMHTNEDSRPDLRSSIHTTDSSSLYSLCDLVLQPGLIGGQKMHTMVDFNEVLVTVQNTG